MSAQLTLVAGTTTSAFFQILDAGEPLDLTDFTVTLLLKGVDGVAVSTTVTTPDATQGIVAWTPGTLTVALSPYKARWVLTEDTGAIAYIPSSYREEWDVVSA